MKSIHISTKWTCMINHNGIYGGVCVCLCACVHMCIPLDLFWHWPIVALKIVFFVFSFFLYCIENGVKYPESIVPLGFVKRRMLPFPIVRRKDKRWVKYRSTHSSAGNGVPDQMVFTSKNYREISRTGEGHSPCPGVQQEKSSSCPLGKILRF